MRDLKQQQEPKLLSSLTAGQMNVMALQLALTVILVIVCVAPASMFTFKQFEENRHDLLTEAQILARFVDAEYQKANGNLQQTKAQIEKFSTLILRSSTAASVRTNSGEIIFDRNADVRWPQITSVSYSSLGPVELTSSINHRLLPILTFVSLALATLGTGLYVLHRRIVPGWRRSQVAEQEVKQRFTDIASVSSDWFWELDTSLKFRFNTCPAIGSTRRENLIGKTLWDIPDLAPKVSWTRVKSTLANEDFLVLHYQVTHGQHTYWHEIKGRPFYDNAGNFKGYRGAGKDITLRQQHEEKLEKLAYCDALTGLCNLNGMCKKYGTLSEHQSSCLLVLLDLSGTRYLNSTFGFELGNAYIVAAANTLLDRLQNTGVVYGLSHPGSDKLAFMTDASFEQICKKLKRLQNSMVSAGTHQLHLQFCAGVALFSQHQDIHSVLQNCELALLEAKRNGRGSVIFQDEAMLHRSLENAELLNHISSGIENDEFFLVFQPKYDLNTEQPESAEALIRWQHANDLIMPGRFIPLLEQVNMMLEIDRWVIHEACKTLRNWLDKGLMPMQVSINLSSQSLDDKDLIRYLIGTAAEYRVSPTLLEIELTEYKSLSKLEHTFENLTLLHTAGFALAIDDYGTGHSNLELLSRLPIDHLKIDQVFVKQGFNSIRDSKILQNVVQLGLITDVKITAEGVETAEQRDRLRDMGCHYAQGYFYSKPINEEQFRELLSPITAHDLTERWTQQT